MSATDVAPRASLWLPVTGGDFAEGQEYSFEGIDARLTIEAGDFGDDAPEVLIEAHVVYHDETPEGQFDLMPVRLYMGLEQAAYLAGALTVASVGQEGLAENGRLRDAARVVGEELRHLARGKAAARRVPTERLRAWANRLQGREA